MSNNKEKNLDDPVTWKESGNEFFNKGQYEEAAKCYSHAIELDPDFIDAWNNMGLSLLKLGKINEAKQCNEKVKKLKEKQKPQLAKTPLPIEQIKSDAPSISKKTEDFGEIRRKYEEGELSYNQYQDFIKGRTEKTNFNKDTTERITIPPTTNKSNIRTPTDIPLIEGENPIWFGQMSWAANWIWFLAAIVFCWTIILPILFVIFAWINVATSEYFISNKRIYYKYGLIRRVANDLKLEWITNTSISQGFVGRILDYGNVLIATPGTETGTSMFWGPKEPMKIKGIVENQIANHKKTEQIRQSLRTLNDEFRMGRLDEDRYNTLKNEYSLELEKYSN